MKRKAPLLILFAFFSQASLIASENNFGSENLWTSGKIYVVLTVVLIILLGIIFFLLHLEKRIRKLEK
ncbi:MAG: CcmD family protein [Chitinophagales bacterium]